MSEATAEQVSEEQESSINEESASEADSSQEEKNENTEEEFAVVRENGKVYLVRFENGRESERYEVDLDEDLEEKVRKDRQTSKKPNSSGEKASRIYEILIETLEKEGLDKEHLRNMSYSELLAYAHTYAKEKYGIKQTFVEPENPDWLEKRMASLPSSIRWMYYAGLETGENIEADEDLILSILRTKGRIIFEDRGTFGVGLRNKFLGINTTKVYGQDSDNINDALLLVDEHRGGADLINYSKWHVDPSEFKRVFNIAGQQKSNITQSYIGGEDEIMPFFVSVKGINYPPSSPLIIKGAGHWDMSKNPEVLTAIGNDIKGFYN